MDFYYFLSYCDNIMMNSPQPTNQRNHRKKTHTPLHRQVLCRVSASRNDPNVDPYLVLLIKHENIDLFPFSKSNLVVTSRNVSKISHATFPSKYRVELSQIRFINTYRFILSIEYIRKIRFSRVVTKEMDCKIKLQTFGWVVNL